MKKMVFELNTRQNWRTERQFEIRLGRFEDLDSIDCTMLKEKELEYATMNGSIIVCSTRKGVKGYCYYAKNTVKGIEAENDRLRAELLGECFNILKHNGYEYAVVEDIVTIPSALHAEGYILKRVEAQEVNSGDGSDNNKKTLKSFGFTDKIKIADGYITRDEFKELVRNALKNGKNKNEIAKATGTTWHEVDKISKEFTVYELMPDTPEEFEAIYP